MKKLFVIFFLFLSTNTYAEHALGMDMYYEHVSGVKYVFFIKMYRNCSKTPMGNISNVTHLYCPGSGKSQGVSLTRQSIKEVTKRCPKSWTNCLPSNSSGGSYGVEMHTYSVTIDFAKAPYSSLLSCSNSLELRTLLCCRSELITTGPGTRQIYHSISFNPNKTPKNSSPRFVDIPDVKLCYGLPTYLSYNAIDEDGDSLSYHIEEAQIDSTRKVQYNASFSAQNPLNTYDPSGTGATDPDASPPVGFYLDQGNGQVIFTPTKVGQGGIIRVAVKDWRKDSTGKWYEVGKTSREMVVAIVNCNNNPPKITNTKFDFTVCEGSDFTFQVTAEDKVLVPPPPTPKPDPDTVTYYLAENLTTATLTKANTRSLSGPAYFRWKPTSAHVSDKPYVFLITAQDNNCPYPLSVTKQFTVTVNKAHVGTTSFNELSCGVYELKAQMDSAFKGKPLIDWMIYDKGGAILDSNEIVFSSTKTSIGHNMLDTVTITSEGTYYIRVQINNGQCNYVSFDTIHTDGQYKLFPDTQIGVCLDDSFSVSLDANVKRIYNTSILTLNSSSGDTVSGLMKNNWQKVYLKAVGKKGCLLQDSVTILPKCIPEIVKIDDSIHCEKSEPIFTINDTANTQFNDTKYVWSTGDSVNSIEVNRTGQYWVRASNNCGSLVDSFEVIKDTLHKVDLGPDQWYCKKYTVGLVDVNYRSDVVYHWLGTVDDKETLFVDTTGTYILAATNVCGTSRDSLLVEFLTPPHRPAWLFTESFCDEIIDTLDAENPGSTYLWNDGSKERTRIIREPGNVSVDISNACSTITAKKVYELKKTPIINLGNDRYVSNPFIVFLNAGFYNNAKYLWSTGQRDRSIFVDTFGTYWVEVSTDCGTDSDTVDVFNLLSVDDLEESNIVVYPNPSKGTFYIKDVVTETTSIKLFDAIGQEIPFVAELVNNHTQVTMLVQTPGLKFLHIKTETETIISMILVNI